MKKSLSLVLALVFVLGIAGTALAANPFVDVPAKHWSYDAVNKLVKAGIVDGYDDGTFRGDKTMTRYEMAQIVAKALAKEDKADAANKALIEKLSAEYSAELDNLGVRVSKLEKNQSNLKFTGDVRVRWNNTTDKADGQMWKDRFRLNMTSQINDKTSLYARFVFADDKFNQDSNQRLSDLALTTKDLIGSTDVTVGRYTLNMGPTTYLSGSTGDVDGIMTNTKSGNFSLMLGYAQARQTTNPLFVSNSMMIKNFGYAEATYTLGKAKVYADYFKNYGEGDNSGVTTPTTTYTTIVDPDDATKYITTAKTTNDPVKVADAYDILGGGLVYTFDSNWKVVGEYYKNKAEAAKWDGDDSTATIARIAYKGAVASKPHTYGLTLDWVKFEGNALPYKFAGPMFLTNPADFGVTGYKAYNAEFDYTLAKNVTFNAMYQFNVKGLNGENPYDHFTRAQINYLF